MVYLKDRNTPSPHGSSSAVVNWRRQLRGWDCVSGKSELFLVLIMAVLI